MKLCSAHEQALLKAIQAYGLDDTIDERKHRAFIKEYDVGEITIKNFDALFVAKRTITDQAIAMDGPSWQINSRCPVCVLESPVPAMPNGLMLAQPRWIMGIAQATANFARSLRGGDN